MVFRLSLPCHSALCSTSSSQKYVTTPKYKDARDNQWDNAFGREVIRAMVEEAGISEKEMRNMLNNELDQRGLLDWANGN